MIRLALPSGVWAGIDPLGATLTALVLPDRAGRLADVLLSPATRGGGPYMGVTVGRYANRIAGAAFALDGTTHRLSANDGPNCLHGGAEGFDARDWQVAESEPRGVTLRLSSPDGDQGFPGRLTAEAAYALSEDAAGVRLALTLTATTDRATPVSLTNHAYLNLSGGDETIEDHRLGVAARRYLPVTPAAIPLPEAPAPVAGTPFDLRTPARLGERLAAPHPQIAAMGGIDHCLALDGHGLSAAATLAHPRSGRRMVLWTDAPGMQVYTGNGLSGVALRGGGVARRWGAVCLEPGAWPDAPNRADFPSAILRPGAVYRHRLLWVFPRPA